MTPAGAGLAALIGLSLGLLGGGGSILTVPVFVYALGFSAKEAVAMSLLVVGAVSLLGVLGHWRAGQVNLRVAALFGGVAMAGTYLGARLAVFVSGQMQLALFAVVAVVAALFMMSGRPRLPEAVPSPSGALPGEMPILVIALEGLAVGVLTGLVGVGGGFLIVPALVLLARVPMKQAIGTSLLVIAMKSGAGFLGYLGQVEIPWGFIGAFSGTAAGGILLGAVMARHVPQAVLRRAFAVFLLLTGGFMLYQSRGIALPGIDPGAAHAPEAGSSPAGD